MFYRVAAEALRILLARAQLDEVMKRLDEDKAWDAMKELNTHVTGITLLARCVHTLTLGGFSLRSLYLHQINAGTVQ